MTGPKSRARRDRPLQGDYRLRDDRPLRDRPVHARPVGARRAAAFLLVVCVVLAGCNGVFGGGSESEAPPTFTPAAVPTDAPTPTPVPEFAPGLTAEGVVDARALAAAHDAVLENASFTARRTVAYRSANGTVLRRIESTTRVGDDGRFRVTRRWNGTSTLERVAYYDDGERLVVATTDAENATSYRRGSGAVAGRLDGTDRRRIEEMFVAAETRVVDRAERDGTTIYRLVPAGNRRTRSNDTTDRGRSVSVRAHVSERGLVREYTLAQRLSGSGSDGTTSIVVTARYTEVGSTVVEQPPWYGAAITATNATASNRTDQP